MNIKRSTLLPCFALMGLIALAVVLAGCGGGSSTPYVAGPVVCDPLSQQSYKYTVHATQNVAPSHSSPSAAASSAPGHPLFGFSESIEGQAGHGTHIDASVTNSDGYNTGSYEVIELDKVGYLNDGNSGWVEQDASRRPLPLRYHPIDLCTALAPDINPSALGPAQSEDVNGIASHKFVGIGVPTKFFAREPDFGYPSDAANFLSTFDGDIWLADNGNYPTKITFAANGQYENGQAITVTIDFEVFQMGQDLTVMAPPLSTIFATPGPGATAVPQPPTVLTANNAALGKNILVNTAGRALYSYEGDVSGASPCPGSCWQPFTTVTGLVQPGPGVTGSLTVIFRANDQRQITYNRVPLFTYQLDVNPGDVAGDGLDGFHVVTP